MSNNNVQDRLQKLGIEIPQASKPAAKYANYVISNGFMYVSGKGPRGGIKGKLGKEFSTEEGYQFARETGIEILAVIQEALGSLDKVKKVVKLQGFVNVVENFEELHKVLNGTSDLMIQVFGENGNHARSVLGAHSLRDNLPIIVDSIFEVEIQGEDAGPSFAFPAHEDR